MSAELPLAEVDLVVTLPGSVRIGMDATKRGTEILTGALELVVLPKRGLAPNVGSWDI